MAPQDGVVKITGAVQLIRNTSAERLQYTGADGVRVAIQLEGAELWNARIGADNYDPQTPAGVDTVTVRRGDRLYFRVQSVYDGAYDNVAWAPEVTYLNVDATRTDVNGLPFMSIGRRRTSRSPGGAARSRAAHRHAAPRRHLGKTGATTDDVTLVITRNGAEVYRRTLAA